MKNLKPSFVPVGLWFIISVILLTLPGSAFPKEDWLSKIWFDKWVHIGMFLIMVILFCWGILSKEQFLQKRSQYFLLAAFICLAYGVIMEFVQDNFIPNRSLDTGDMLADAAGCFTGWFFAVKRFIKK
jgi:VanZ family protein